MKQSPYSKSQAQSKMDGNQHLTSEAGGQVQSRHLETQFFKNSSAQMYRPCTSSAFENTLCGKLSVPGWERNCTQAVALHMHLVLCILASGVEQSQWTSAPR